MKITSTSNARIKRARQVREGKDRSLLFVEGERLATEALDAGLSVTEVFITGTFRKRQTKLVSRLEAEASEPVAEVGDAVLKSLADTQSPQGVVMLVQRPTEPESIWEGSGEPLLLVLDGVQDPGNVGTLLRTAEAAGATAVILMPGCPDPFSPKVLRSAMGSAFRLPLVQGWDFETVQTRTAEHNCRLMAADGGAEQTHCEADWQGPLAILLGNEGSGLSADVLGLCDARVRIPMAGAVESLNVATAGAVLLFEAAGRRA